MKTLLHILAAGILANLLACHNSFNEHQSKIDTIKKVTVAFSGSGCEGICPYEALSIDKNLQMTFYGGPGSKKYGNYKGKIDQATWDSVKSGFRKFMSVGIDTLKYGKTDHPDVEFIIDCNTKSQHFKENTGKISESDLALLYWYIELALSNRKIALCDTLAFETTLQNSKFGK